MTGYTSSETSDRQLAVERALSETVPGPSVDHFARLARELGVYIVWALQEQDGSRYYNTATLLSPAGKLVGKYRKVHINKYEEQMGWTNGDQFFTWPCEVHGVSFNLGIMICYDREMPEAARCLTMQGADLIVVPQATAGTCDVPIHRDQLRVRAFENEVCIALANWGGERFKGHSMLIGPDGKTQEIGGRDEQILMTAFNLTALRKLREKGIYGRHCRQPGAYGPLMESN